MFLNGERKREREKKRERESTESKRGCEAFFSPTRLFETGRVSMINP